MAHYKKENHDPFFYNKYCIAWRGILILEPVPDFQIPRNMNM
jgi:hypothetical protein